MGEPFKLGNSDNPEGETSFIADLFRCNRLSLVAKMCLIFHLFVTRILF